MRTDIDTRLRSAADSLERAAERISPAARPRSLRPVAAAVVGTIAVGLVAGTLAVRDGGPDEPLSPPPVVPRLIPEALPAGYRAGGAAHLVVDPSVLPGSYSVDVYGDPGADDPFADADLMIYVSDQPVMDEFEGDTDPVTVRGHEGFVDAFLGDGLLLRWEESPGLSVGVGSWSLDRAHLLAIAERLDVDVLARTVGPLPDDISLAPVGSADDLATAPGLAPLGLAVPASGNGSAAYYGTDDYLFPGHAVAAAFRGDAGDLAVARWLSGADTATVVRGRPGWEGTFEPPPFDDGEGIVPESENRFMTSVVWEEAPGVVALVQLHGHGEGDALALAESLRPATSDEWSRLLNLGASGDVYLADEERLARGQLAKRDRLESADIPMAYNAVNGAEGVYGVAGVWATWLLPDGTLCGAVLDETATDPVVTCDPDGASVIPIPDNTGRPVLIIGVMPEGAVGRIAVGGEVEEVQTVRGPNDAPRYYVLAIAGDAVPSAITFVAADGTDLSTVPVES